MRPVAVYILMLICGLRGFSQTDRLDSLLNEIFYDDREMIRFINAPSSYCYLYSGIMGDSKTFYAGREIGDKMYSVNGSVYFLHSKGFYIGTSGLWYSQLDPGYSTTIVTTGFFKSLNPKKSITLRTSYSRYFYNSGDYETSNAFSNNLGISISFRKSWIGTRHSFNFLFGQDFGMNFTPNIFLRIPVARFGKNSRIRIEPEAYLFFGSEYVEYTVTDNLNSQQSAPQSSLTTNNDYGLLNTQFYLPVCIYLGDFDIELGCSVNIPNSQDKSIDYPVSSFFSISLGYLLPLN
ncbi:MAG: hypothetical protein JSV22_08605 [Bacteroidales bacterium]|nr:MAG: hypothetical protein JSV22_08605 [Bacteroidales bacterium]